MSETMPLGDILRAEREKKGLTLSDVAEGTRIKVQVLETIENNDFSRIPAPVYGKGFIKLYAEFLGLDPAPLIEEYASRLAVPVRPSLRTNNASGTDSATPTPANRPAVRGTIFSTVVDWRRIKRDLSEALWKPLEQTLIGFNRMGETSGHRKRTDRTRPFRGTAQSSQKRLYAAIAVGVLLLLVFAGVGMSRFVKRPGPAATACKPALSASLRLAEDPPPPYIQ